MGVDGAVYQKINKLEKKIDGMIEDVSSSADNFSTMATVEDSVTAGENFVLHPNGKIGTTENIGNAVEGEDVVRQYGSSSNNRMCVSKVFGMENRYIRAYKQEADRSMISIELFTVDDATGLSTVLDSATVDTPYDDHYLDFVMDDVAGYFVVSSHYGDRDYWAYKTDGTTISYIGTQRFAGIDSSDYYVRGYALRNGVGVMLDYGIPNIFKFEVTDTTFNYVLDETDLGVGGYGWTMGIWNNVDSYYFVNSDDIVKITLNDDYTAPTVEVIVGDGNTALYEGTSTTFIQGQKFIKPSIANGVLTVAGYDMETSSTFTYTKDVGMDIGMPYANRVVRQNSFVQISDGSIWYASVGTATTSLAKFWFADENNFGVERLFSFPFIYYNQTEGLIDIDTATNRLRLIYIYTYGSYSHDAKFYYKSLPVDLINKPRINGFLVENKVADEETRIFFNENIFKNTNAPIGSTVAGKYGVLANGSMVPIF